MKTNPNSAKKARLVKTLAILFMIIGANKAVTAQGFRLGLHVQPGLAWLSTQDKDVSNDGTRFSFAYGAILDYYFTDNYAISTGMSLAYRGGNLKYDNAGNDAITSKKLMLQYVDIPITLKMKTNQIGKVYYFGQFGLDASIKVGADAEITKASKTEKTSITGDINTFAVGLNVGGGIEIPIAGKTAIILGLNYHNGFSDIFDGTPKAYSRHIALSLGILF
jgi:opacity protein-like surface antigen